MSDLNIDIPGTKKCDSCSVLQVKSYEPSQKLFNRVFQRNFNGNLPRNLHSVADNYIAHKLPQLLKGNEYTLGSINKIFAAKWLNERQIVLGTKCNKIYILDTVTRQLCQIPSLKSSVYSIPADCPCGIHTIAINPSRTLLATGAENTNDLAVYRLPYFDPYCTAENGHVDWIFDAKWLDDEFILTGSRDNHLALWRIKDDQEKSRGSSDSESFTRKPPSASSPLQSSPTPHSSMQSTPSSSSTAEVENKVELPVLVKTCTETDKIRALSYHKQNKEIGALSLNAMVHFWDVETMTRKQYRKLQFDRDNVCLECFEELNLHAVGSQSHVSIIDNRDPKTIKIIKSPQPGCGIRSLGIRSDVISIGTGDGALYFYDLRAGRYLKLGCNHPFCLNTSKGFFLTDMNYLDHFAGVDQSHAIYAHGYSPSGSKILMAGGPLPAALHGNVCTIFE